MRSKSYGDHTGFTLGTITYAYTNRYRNNDARINWDVLTGQVSRSNSDVREFEDVVQRMLTEQMREKRNLLAHGEAISREVATSLRDCVIGDRRHTGILCWLAEHVGMSST